MAASEAFKLLIDNLQRSSRSDANVLINGEVGTGRRQCALSIHKASRRSNGRFVTVNCTALNASHFGIEMFGLQNEAFEMVRKGTLFLAEEGTIYLHEIAELSLDMQAQLVRYLESGVFSPVGSNDVIASNVRMICSTSANLTALVAAGRFRNDLYHMVAQMVINTPTLNERIADIELLASNILREIAPNQPFRLHAKAYYKLLSHNFTGNLIELRNILLRAISMTSNHLISEDIMHHAINAGSLFNQSNDMHDRNISMESTVQSELDNSLTMLEKRENATKSLTNAGNSVMPGDQTEAMIANNRKSRWALASDAEVDNETVDQKLNEFASSQSFEDFKPEQTSTPRVDKTSPYMESMPPRMEKQSATVKATKPALSLKERELLIIEDLLEKHGGDKQAVANELGCTVRTLYRKIEKIKSKATI